MQDFYGLLDDENDTWVDITPQSAPVFKVPAQIPTTDTEQIDDDPRKNKLTSQNFDASKYVQSQLGQLSYEEFLSQTQQLDNELTIKELGLKSLVRSCFDDFVTAKGQVDLVYAKYNGPDTSQVIQQAYTSMQRILKDSSETFDPLLERKKKADSIRFTLQTLSRYALLFQLPVQVAEAANGKAQLDQLIREIKKGKVVLMANQKRAAFVKVWQELQKSIQILIAALTEQLQHFGEEALLDDKERVLLYIAELDKLTDTHGRNTESILIQSLHGHIQNLLRQQYRKFLDDIDLIADSYLLQTASQPEQLNDIKFGNALMLSSDAEQYKQVFSQDSAQKGWEAVRSLLDGADHIMTGIFSELARLARNSIDGRYSEQSVSQIKAKRDLYTGYMNDIVKLYADIGMEAIIHFTTSNAASFDMGLLYNKQGSEVDSASFSLFAQHMKSNTISLCVNVPAILIYFEDAYVIARKSVTSVYAAASRLGVVDNSKSSDQNVPDTLKQEFVQAVCHQWSLDVATMYKYHDANGQCLKYYKTYTSMIYSSVSQVFQDGQLPLISTAQQQASLLLLDGYHFLALHPTAAYDYTDVSKNLAHILEQIDQAREVLLTELAELFINKFQVGLQTDEFQKAANHLYDTVFRMHVFDMSSQLTPMLNQGILYSGNEWCSDKSSSLKVHGFINEVLLKLVSLLAGQQNESMTFQKLRSSLVLHILETMRFSFQKIDVWSQDGCLKAVVDVNALSFALNFYVEQDASCMASCRKLQGMTNEQFKTAAKQEVPQSQVDAAVQQWAKSCEVLLKCFQL